MIISQRVAGGVIAAVDAGLNGLPRASRNGPTDPEYVRRR